MVVPDPQSGSSIRTSPPSQCDEGTLRDGTNDKFCPTPCPSYPSLSVLEWRIQITVRQSWAVTTFQASLRSVSDGWTTSPLLLPPRSRPVPTPHTPVGGLIPRGRTFLWTLPSLPDRTLKFPDSDPPGSTTEVRRRRRRPPDVHTLSGPTPSGTQCRGPHCRGPSSGSRDE